MERGSVIRYTRLQSCPVQLRHDLSALVRRIASFAIGKRRSKDLTMRDPALKVSG